MIEHASIIEHLGELNPEALVVGGQPVQCAWDMNQDDPILDENRVLVAIPDLHWSDGGGADIFRGSAPAHAHRDRMEQFLRGLVAAKAELAAQGKRVSVVQLGDCYDVWRAFPFTDEERGRTYAAIDSEYATCLSLLIDELDCRFCVGNHDAILAQYPPDWAFGAGARLAYSQRFCAGRVFCFHGHQGDAIADQVAGQDGKNWVALGSILSSVSNATGIALQRAIDGHRDEHMSPDGGWLDGVAPNDDRFRAPRWADYGGKPERFAKLVQGMNAVVPAVADAVRLLIVGHTHRPGVAWFTRNGRTIPIVDVGSWTYGRSQFALATEGLVAVYQI